MARGMRADKLGVWRQRLAKFSASGLSVAAFCRREDIAPARFYYWSRRVREAGLHIGRENRDIVSNHDREPTTADSSVEVCMGEDIKVCLPGSDRELIKFVLSCLKPDSSTSDHNSAFQRIELSDSLAATR